MLSVEDAPGVGGGPTRFAYASEEGLVPTLPATLVTRIADAREQESHLSASPFELLGHEPLSDAVAAAVDYESATAYAKVAGVRIYAGVDGESARDTLAERGTETTESDISVFNGEDWAAGATENAVVEAAAPLADSVELRRQYVPAVIRARRGTGRRLLETDEPTGRVASVLPAGQYVILHPAVSDFNFESEAFSASIRGEQSVLATARLARAGNDPSKRNARLLVLDRWNQYLSPDADVSNVTVLKRGSVVRVTGVVETSKLTLDE